MNLGVVIPTTGQRLEELLRCVRSVPSETPIAIGWQSQEVPPRSLAELAGSRRLKIVNSSGGISLGRNDALKALLECSIDGVIFPNDDSYFGDGFFETLKESEADAILIAPVLKEQDDAGLVGSRGHLRFSAAHGGLLQRLLKSAHEPGVIFPLAGLMEVGGFDPILGVGNASPWQSGEGVDVLMRLAACGWPIRDAPDGIYILEAEQEQGAGHRLKRLRYDRGTSYLVGRHLRSEGALWLLARHSVAHVARARSVRAIAEVVEDVLAGYKSQDRHRSQL